MYLCAQNHDLKRGGTFETAKAGTFHSVTAGTSIPLFTQHSCNATKFATRCDLFILIITYTYLNSKNYARSKISNQTQV